MLEMHYKIHADVGVQVRSEEKLKINIKIKRLDPCLFWLKKLCKGDIDWCVRWKNKDDRILKTSKE